MLLAVDPSIRSVGASLWCNGHLVACTRITGKLPTSAPIGERCLAVARDVVSWQEITRLTVGRGSPLQGFITEWPQIHTLGKSKGDPNDLIGLAGVGMAIAGLLPKMPVRTPTAAEWIGQCPKVCQRCKGKASNSCKRCKGSSWLTPRGERIGERLSAVERTHVPDQHDVIDSVGIGLWSVGRLALAVVFPGAV